MESLHFLSFFSFLTQLPSEKAKHINNWYLLFPVYLNPCKASMPHSTEKVKDGRNPFISHIFYVDLDNHGRGAEK
jgi:hypothetical protein